MRRHAAQAGSGLSRMSTCAGSSSARTATIARGPRAARRRSWAWLARRSWSSQFTGSFFPFEGAKIKTFFERLKQFEPDVVFTHYRDDRHQDHRVLSDLAWNTFRNHLVLEYEIPKYDGDLGIPNLFVPIDDDSGPQRSRCSALSAGNVGRRNGSRVRCRWVRSRGIGVGGDAQGREAVRGRAAGWVRRDSPAPPPGRISSVAHRQCSRRPC